MWQKLAVSSLKKQIKLKIILQYVFLNLLDNHLIIRVINQS